MSYLADTHALLWARESPENLGRAARAVFENAEEEIFFSMASVWEIAIKVGLGKLKLDMTVEEFVEAQFANACRLLPIRVSHAAGQAALPMHHRDPFDRMLIAQAKVERLTLLTADRAFRAYKIKTLW